MPRLTSFLVERGVRAIAYETVQTPDGRLPLLAPMSEIAGRMAPQEGAKYLERPVRRPRRPDGRRERGAARAGGRPRRRHGGMERRRDRRRHAGRGRRRRQERRPPARDRPDLAGSHRDHDVVASRGRAARPGRRPGDRRGARARREGAASRDRGHGHEDAARRRDGRHLDRPGWLLRDVARDHARRPHVRRRRRRALRGRQHAGRGAAHLHLRAHERHAARTCSRSRPTAWSTRSATTRRSRSASTPGTAGSRTRVSRRRPGSRSARCRPDRTGHSVGLVLVFVAAVPSTEPSKEPDGMQLQHDQEDPRERAAGEVQAAADRARRRAAAAHSAAAVVRPFTPPDARKMMPAPRNPTPVATPWTIRSAE